MCIPPVGPLGNRKRPLIVLLLLLLVQPWACNETKEIKEEVRKELEIKEPIGIITTTNYCQGGITASTEKIKPGYIALSRDIEKQHGLKFGDLIYFEDETEPYVFMDRMPLEWKRHADLYSRRCKDAKEYGVQKRMVWFVRKQ